MYPYRYFRRQQNPWGWRLKAFLLNGATTEAVQGGGTESSTDPDKKSRRV